MGLLRRAAVAAGSGNKGDKAPVPASARKNQPKGPGLLQRSLKALQPLKAAVKNSLSIGLAESQGQSDILPFRIQAQAQTVEGKAPVSGATEGGISPAGVVPYGRHFEDIRAGVLAAIDSLRSGVELPSRLFTALATLLGILKGALLLYDPIRFVYAPWAVRGYDQTTLHRMRIPLGANEPWNALANGSPLIFTDSTSLALFRRYFSAREFSSVGRLILVPFIAEEKLIAVLLVTDVDSPLANDKELVACLAQAAESGAPRVYKAREAQISAADRKGMRLPAATIDDEPAKFLASLGGSGKNVLLGSLSLEEFSKSVLSTHENLDPFRLHEDLHFFLGSFVADVGRALPVRQGRFIIALPDYDPAGLDLFLHQLSLYLHGLFSGSAAPEERVMPRLHKSLSWPADGADLQTLVRSLSS